MQEATRLADVAHSRLVEHGLTVAVAESLTGGMVGMLLTAAPATTVTFRGGMVVYATDLKHELAGVDEGVLEEHGAVHPIVAQQLAVGARQRLRADIGIGLTGVAGPGEQDGHPVGEVFVAIAAESGVTCTAHLCDGTRADIRAGAAAAALGELVAALERLG